MGISKWVFIGVSAAIATVYAKAIPTFSDRHRQGAIGRTERQTLNYYASGLAAAIVGNPMAISDSVAGCIARAYRS
jgi:hypothetical protein